MLELLDHVLFIIIYYNNIIYNIIYFVFFELILYIIPAVPRYPRAEMVPKCPILYCTYYNLLLVK